MRLAILIAFAALPANAQDGVRPTDVIFGKEQLSDILSGQVIEFFDGSKSRYGDDGSYGYTYTDDGPAWTGLYAVQDEGTVCVDFDNGSRRCDQFVEANDRLTLVTTDGLRFPVRNRTVYQR